MNGKQLRLYLAPVFVIATGFGCGNDDGISPGALDGIADPDDMDPSGMEDADEGGDADAGEDDGHSEPECGNGQTDPGEACDDGNATDDDECTNACSLPACGDGIVQPSAGEACDDGNNLPGDGCTVSCRLPGAVIADHTTALFDVGNAVVVDSEDHIIILGRTGDGRSSVVKLNSDFSARWKFLPDKFGPRSLAISGEDELLLGGSINDHSHTMRIDPEDGGKIWAQNIIALQPSTSSAVAAAGGHMVSAGRHSMAINKQVGFFARHDRATGNPLANPLEWNEGPFDLVAVDASGWVWVIDNDKSAELRIYSANDTLEHTVGLAEDTYTDIVVDDDRSVYLLAHSIGKQTFTVWKLLENGTAPWPPQHYENASASGLALSPGGEVIVAGHTSDESNGLLVWYDPADGEIIKEVMVGTKGDGGKHEVFNDVAVAPSGAFAVAVGARGYSENNTSMWIYQVEL